eukprot:Nitzschia sp. Nitz4//scaffold110_size71422//32369//33859//NITZ4_005870-RA/size71422-processed-gene-0.6-mRNA-1//1//CDS//3329533077//286//frame0
MEETFLYKLSSCFGGHIISLGTLAYIAMVVCLELWTPQCLFEDWGLESTEANMCLENGVDNSTTTVFTGIWTSFWMFGFAFHLWAMKCCYIPEPDEDGSDDRGNIRPAGIWAQAFMGLSVLLPCIGRILQPDAHVGKAWYWFFYAASFPMAAIAVDFYGYFAKKSLPGHRWNDCCRGFLTRIGFSSTLVLVSALMVCAAGLWSAFMHEGSDSSESEVATSSETSTGEALDNIFDSNELDTSSSNFLGTRHLLRRQLASSKVSSLNLREMEWDTMSQKIVYYGNFAFLFSCFFFWSGVSSTLRNAIQQREQQSKTEERFHVLGLDCYHAASWIPVISFAMGSLYPVWIWLAADFSRQYWLEVSIVARGNIVYHYGLWVLAVFAHALSSALTFHSEADTVVDDEGQNDWGLGLDNSPEGRKNREELINDLTLDAFKKPEPKSYYDDEAPIVYEEPLFEPSRSSRTASHRMSSAPAERSFSLFGSKRQEQPQYRGDEWI